MARARIEIPQKFHFTTEIRIRITDINYGGHLGNDALLSIIQEARMRFLRHYKYSEKNVDGSSIIMADAVIVYKSQGFYGDILKIDITAVDFSKHACDLIYFISNKKTGKEIARAKTRIAFYDYENQKTMKIPDKFRKIFNTHPKF
jgi:acyl-CoA thioester hydrolase